MLNGIVESYGKYSSSLFIKKQIDVDKFTLKKCWELLLHEKYQSKKNRVVFQIPVNLGAALSQPW